MLHATTKAALGLLSATLTLGVAASVDHVLRDPRGPVAPILREAARAAQERAAAMSSPESANPACPPLARIGDQLVRADNLTGTGGPASPWLPASPE